MRATRSNPGITSHSVDSTPGERDTDGFSKFKFVEEGDADLGDVNMRGEDRCLFTRPGELPKPIPGLPSGGRGDASRRRGTSIDWGSSLGTEIITFSEGESRQGSASLNGRASGLERNGRVGNWTPVVGGPRDSSGEDARREASSENLS